MGESALYNWYRHVQKKDLGEGRVGWLQYLEDKAKSPSSESTQKNDLKSHQIDDNPRDDGQCKGNKELQCNVSRSPQQEKDLSDSSFWEKFEEAAPLTPFRNTSLLDKSSSPSLYSPTIPLVDFFSPANSDNSKTDQIAASLGANFEDSSVTWTSALATPSDAESSKGKRDSPSTLERHTLHPKSALRQKVMARTLFSPRTPGGQHTSSSEEWSPNLGIIKCHSPVLSFGSKGYCSTPKSSLYSNSRVNQTQEFEISGSKSIVNRGSSVPLSNSRVANVLCTPNDEVNPPLSDKGHVKPKSNLPIVRLDPFASTPEDRENMSVSACVDFEHIDMSKDTTEADKLIDVNADNSERKNENPFDIICSPIKKKIKTNAKPTEKLRSDLRSRVTERDKDDSLACLSGETLNVVKIARATSSVSPVDSKEDTNHITVDKGKSDLGIEESKFKARQIENHHPVPEEYDNSTLGTRLKNSSSLENSYSDDKIDASHNNCALLLKNDVATGVDVSLESEQRSTSGVSPESAKPKSGLHEQRPLGSTSAVSPEFAKPKISHGKLNILGKRKSNTFKYPTKSDGGYEKLGLAFKKTLTNEKSVAYRSYVDCVAKPIQSPKAENQRASAKLAEVESPLQNQRTSANLVKVGSSFLNQRTKADFAVVGSSLQPEENQMTRENISEVGSSSDVQIQSHPSPLLSKADERLTALGVKPIKGEMSHGKSDIVFADMLKSPKMNSFPVFATASGAKMKVSEESLKKAQSLWQDIENDDFTAAGHIDSSPKSPHLEKTKEVFSSDVKSLTEHFTKSRVNSDDIANTVSLHTNSKSPDLFQGFTTGLGTKVKITEEQLKRSRALFEEAVDLSNDCEVSNKNSGYTNTVSPEPFKGFTTGKGTKVKITEEQLKKSRALFKEAAAQSDISNVPAKNAFNTSSSVSPKPFQGFTTGLGTKVKITEEQLKKSRALFEEAVDQSDTCKVPTKKLVNATTTKSPETFQGFTTGLGTKVKITEEQLKRSKALFQDAVDQSDTFDVPTEDAIDTSSAKSLDPFQGFTTGLGTKVKITEEQLKKSRALFEEAVDQIDTYEVSTKKGVREASTKSLEVFKGFTTGLGTKVKITEEQLKKSRAPFEEAADQINTCEVSTKKGVSVASTKSPDQFQGFTTGLGTKVKFTEEQLKRSRALFEEAVDQNDTSEVSFKKSANTASTSGVMKPITFEMTDSTDEGRDLYKRNIYSTGKANISDVSSKSGLDRDSSKAACDGGMLWKGQNDGIDETAFENENRSDDDDDRSSSPIIGSQCVSKMRIARHARRSVEYSTKGPLDPSNEYASENITNRVAHSHNRKSDSKNRVMESDTQQEIYNITEAFLKDESWEPEEPNNRKRKFHESLEERNVAHPNKHLRQLNFSQSQSDANEVRNMRDMHRIKQERVILNKKRASVQPIQGHLHKERSENKHQRVSLKSLGSLCVFSNCSAKIENVNAGNAGSFRFSISDEQVSVDCGEGFFVIPGPDGCVGVIEVEQGFLAMPGVCPKLLPVGWVHNNFTWIVWKLAAMQRRLVPNKFLTLENVVARLKYRYDREIDHAERSIIRKIYECDDIPQKTMVLCIASLCNEGNIGQNISPQKYTDVPFMTLTDGWYSIKAHVDNAMIQLHSEGKIKAGMKLVIHGAELMGHPSPCHPLDAPSSASLRLHTNMTRRARWWSRLGLIPQRRSMPVQLSSVFVDGGLVGRVSVVIVRVYPLIYYEKDEGKSYFRGEKAHLKLMRESQQQKETALHQIISEVEKEFDKKTCSSKSIHSRSSLAGKEIGRLRTGEDIAQFIENTADPTTVGGLLTTSQIDMAQKWRQEQASEREREINSEVQQRLAGKQKIYEATPLLKVRLLDTLGCDAMLTVWRPPEELQQELSEGMAFNIQYVMASGYRRGCLQMTASRQTLWERIHNRKSGTFPNVNRRVTPFACFSSSSFNPTWNEVDVVGVVFKVREMNKGLQLVHMTDHSLNLLTIKFWGGLKDSGFEEIVQKESIMCITNGSWRGHDGGRCSSIHVTEFTTLSSTPRKAHLVEAITALKGNIKDMKALMQEADLKLDGSSSERDATSINRNVSNVHNDDDGNLEQVREVESSVVPVETSVAINQTVASNESTSVSNESSIVQNENEDTKCALTPEAKKIGERSRDMRCRLRKLRQYGPPPPLGSVLLNKPLLKTNRPFRSPMRKLDS